ncbi:MAG: cobalamin B12-binding domain-containing protein, partial [Actinomycetota bacterium]|nr:cobalamin B12-binding domain-containing protein [Actinomycetota bacterium]
MDASRESSADHIRIGELSRRVGVSVELLRAWERRYELLSPLRTEGGFRLYSEDDERRVVRMLDHLAAGMSAAEAARSTLREGHGGSPGPSADAPPPELQGPIAAAVGDQLRRALERLDDTGANAALDRLLSGFALGTVVRDAVLPYLHELGDRWEQHGDAVIAQEHFASALLRGRLLGLARGWGGGHGPMALLACLPGDQHDLGLICFGLGLRANGWRITFLGPDTPFATISETTALLRPALVVLTAMVRPGAAIADELAAIAAQAPLALAGAGLDAGDAAAAG